LHPRLQKGAWSGASGLPHNGQVESGFFGISTGHGQRGVGSQADGAANLTRNRVEPVGLCLKGGDDSRMGDDALGTSAFESHAAKQGTSFEWRAILSLLDERRALPRTDDLNEAEAVDRRSLERLRQYRVDRVRGALPRGL